MKSKRAVDEVIIGAAGTFLEKTFTSSTTSYYFFLLFQTVVPPRDKFYFRLTTFCSKILTRCL